MRRSAWWPSANGPAPADEVLSRVLVVYVLPAAPRCAHDVDGRSTALVHEREKWVLMQATSSRNPAGLTIICATYFALGKASFAVAGLTDSLAAIWLPGGFAIGVLVLFGVRMWPGVFAGALLAYSTTTGYV